MKEICGNTQLIISCHIKNLIKLEKVNGTNFKDLLDISHKVEINVKALKTVGIHQDQVVTLLIPSVLKAFCNSFQITE